jgi:catechol 2,3-dioxygenase
MPPAPVKSAGLFHTAILYPTRKELARIYQRLLTAGYPFTGYADHGVSEALYLDDPDQNGVELYWDRPKEQWPLLPMGALRCLRKHDLQGLLAELKIHEFSKRIILLPDDYRGL